MKIDGRKAVTISAIIGIISVAVSAAFINDGVGQSIKYWIWFGGTAIFAVVIFIFSIVNAKQEDYDHYHLVAMNSYTILFAAVGAIMVVTNYVNDSIFFLIAVVLGGHLIAYFLPTYIRDDKKE